MRKLAILFALAVVLMVVLVPSVALANFAIHGGYPANTDECASCHRAHTAPSAATWTNGAGETRSALLLTNAATVEEFCETCHGVDNLGAETNVVEGIYEGSDHGTSGQPLLGGAFGVPVVGQFMPQDGFGRNISSSHMAAGAAWGAYGGGPDGLGPSGEQWGTGGNDIVMTCTSCHDPHGSSNYRILKDYVYAGEVTGQVRVGGYDAITEAPTPFVISVEEGYPVNGFRLHSLADKTAYNPNYTTAQYARPPANDIVRPRLQKGMSGWCAGCHTQYVGADRNTYASIYDAADGYNLILRHRHPMNTALSNYSGARALVLDPARMTLPVAHDASSALEVGSGGVVNATLDATDFIECLTCHNAHGASSEMTGWAADTNPVDQGLNFEPNDPLTGLPKEAWQKGVPPAGSPALLKLDNRGTCEMCHNK